MEGNTGEKKSKAASLRDQNGSRNKKEHRMSLS
jgi:hypothetical protein